MKRVVVLTWKDRVQNAVEIFSNLKILCESYPSFSYNTLNNYLSKAKVAFENKQARIERLQVQTKAIPQRQMKMVVKRVSMCNHDEEAVDAAYWLSRPVAERLQAVTRLSSMLKKRKNERMNKTHVVRKKI